LEKVVNDLDKSTSPGYPFNLYYATKRDLLEKEPNFLQWLHEDWDNMLKDTYSFCWVNSLKEEIRPEEKTRLNKIRTFSAGAVDGTIHGNRLYADMNEKMNAAFLKTASGVSMSPLKGNWHKLMLKLMKFNKGYALDESEYDSTLASYLMWGCAWFRWNQLAPQFRTPENLQRHLCYYRNLVNSLIISPEGVLVMKLGGNPSGSVNTINDNTLILYVLMAYAWIVLSPKNPSYEEFELNTAKVLVGDDNTWTVSDLAHHFFNGKNVIRVWSEIGITATTDCLEPRHPLDLDFLSATTILYGESYVPLYGRAKLMTSLLYSTKKKQSPSFTLLRAAALLQIGWTDAQFRIFCRSLIDWLLEEFDDLLYDDEEWIQAKTSIHGDFELARLFTGRDFILLPQGFVKYQEVQERFKEPHKSHMAATAAKAENKIYDLCRKRGLTHQGAVWFDWAVDPFKDVEMCGRPHGFPDEITAPSTVQIVPDSFDLVTPNSGQSWDAMICIDQLWLSLPSLLTPTFAASPNTYAQGTQTTASSRGGFLVRTGNTGVALTPAASNVASSRSLKQDMTANSDVRILGIAFEVHDTTAELNRQGAVTVFRVPQTVQKDGIVNIIPSVNGAGGTSYQKIQMSEPPETVGEAIDLPGSMSWEAKHGCYVVSAFTGPQNPPQEFEVFCPVVADVDSGAQWVPTIVYTILSGGQTTAYIPGSNANIMMPFSVSGCYFSGLNPLSTLHVNVRYIVEIFPNKVNLLRRLCDNSPAFDPAALKFYSDIKDRIPVGVKVKDNFAGALIAGIANIGMGLTKFIGNNGTMIGKGIEGLGTMTRAVNSVIPAFTETKNMLSGMMKKQPLAITSQKEVHVPKNKVLVMAPKAHLPKGSQIVSTANHAIISNAHVGRATRNVSGFVNTNAKKDRKKARSRQTKFLVGKSHIGRWVDGRAI
jgi:hypothetical protein